MKIGVSKTMITFRKSPMLKTNQFFDQHPIAVALSLRYLNTLSLILTGVVYNHPHIIV